MIIFARRGTEHRRLHLRWDQRAIRRGQSRIIRIEPVDREVRTEHDALGPELIKAGFNNWADAVGAPVVIEHAQPGQFADNVRQS